MDENRAQRTYSLHSTDENGDQELIAEIITRDNIEVRIDETECKKRDTHNIHKESLMAGINLKVRFDSRNYKRRGFPLINFQNLNTIKTIEGEVSPYSDDSVVGTQAARFISGENSQVIADIPIDTDLSQHTLSLAIEKLAGADKINISICAPDDENRIEGSLTVEGDANFQRVDICWQGQVGNPSLSQAEKLQIRCESTNSDIIVDDLRAIQQPNLDIPLVCFTFDDSLTSHYEQAFQIMNDYGFCGTVYTITGKVGSPGMLNIDQMREMYEYGWEFASHTVSHEPLTEQTQSEINSEIKDSKQWLTNHGFQRGSGHFAPPYSDYNNEIMDKIMKYYHTSTGSQESGCIGQRFASTGLVHRFHGDDKKTVKKSVDNLMNDQIPTNLMILTYHDIGNEDWISIPDFKEIVEYIAKRQIQVITIDELWKHWITS